MLSYYCLKYRKNTQRKNPKVASTKNGKIMLLLNCVVCDAKKSKFIKEQNTNGFLSSFGTRTPLCKIPLVGPLLF